MSSEKTPEMGGCDAPIMKNYWEILEREYGQKLTLEHERLEKSALTSINHDWANRMASKQSKYKRVERKKNPAETENVWKTDLSQPRPNFSRGPGSGHVARPGIQKRGFSTPVHTTKDKSTQDRIFNRLQLLMFITQTQPSAMVWGKSWKYNKSLPSPAEGAAVATDWGQCWMYAAPQPHSEAGQPWKNGPNVMDPNKLHLWQKTNTGVVESRDLDLSLCTEEWQMSYRKPDKRKEDTTSENEEYDPKFANFFSLMESQCHNEALSASEWVDSFRSTKPAGQQNHIYQNDVHHHESVANKFEECKEMGSSWEECWKLVNHKSCNTSNLSQVKTSHNAEWDYSWRAATEVFSTTNKKLPPSLGQGHDEYSQHKDSHADKYVLVPSMKKGRDLHSQLLSEFEALSEWTKSWQVVKNSSKPSEEIEKILKIMPPNMESKKIENIKNKQHTASKNGDHYHYELKHAVLYCPKTEFTQSKMQHLNQMEKNVSAPEWRESWKVPKHRSRIEQKKMRPDPSKPFREAEKGGEMKPTPSEWKDSYKCTCLRQEADLWQQDWPTVRQIRVDRWTENYFAPVELPRNGPTGERNWGESWRVSRTQDHGKQNVFHHPNSNVQPKYIKSSHDWQAAWMFSETQFHHDKPSFTEWKESWRSAAHMEQWTEQVTHENYLNELSEIKFHREKMASQRAKAKFSMTFDNQLFRERYPEKEWGESWRAGSLLNHHLSHGSSGIQERCTTGTTLLQHGIDNDHGSKWGRPFRIANPMPQVEKPWVECPHNLCHYAVMWSRGQKIKQNINATICNNPTTLRLWASSHQFLQGTNGQNRKSKSNEPVDPLVIITKKIKTKRHLYSDFEKQKISEKKWAGCQMLGKTQPRPKKSFSSKKMVNTADDKNDKFSEEWAESWKLLVLVNGLKKQMPVKLLKEWDESWKFLLPQTLNGPRAK